METKKNPNKDVHRFRGLFFFIGLCVSALVMITAFEWRSLKKEIAKRQPSDWGEVTAYEPPIVELRQPTPPQPFDRKTIRVHNPVIIEVDEPLPAESLDSVVIEYPHPVVITLPEPEPTVDVPFERVEVMPEPIGGYPELYRTIAKSIAYPRQAQRAEVEGKVFVQFVVDRDGSLSDLAVVKGVGYGCDE